MAAEGGKERILLLVRHAEGIHNFPIPLWVGIVASAAVAGGSAGGVSAGVAWGPWWPAVLLGLAGATAGGGAAQLCINRERRRRWQHVDPALSEAGRRSVAAARQARRTELGEQQLVVVSPMRRTLETAVGLFADHAGVPIVALEQCREVLENPCDGRATLQELRKFSPRADLSLVSADVDPLRPGSDDPVARVREIAGMLRSGAPPFGSAARITIVSHMNWIRLLLSELGEGSSRLLNLGVRRLALPPLRPAPGAELGALPAPQPLHPLGPQPRAAEHVDVLAPPPAAQRGATGGAGAAP
eukprot:TRINITY_DN47084_c0_g1_i1.p2 TRINITY_DN47084_c0_g1~~TRINITY_DN47084_c0_g1_i1.p2  ORF type:complete len:325 (+),score=75.31 TRINITY_DN47084_c0_g1_i1:73-975(+)